VECLFGEKNEKTRWGNATSLLARSHKEEGGGRVGLTRWWHVVLNSKTPREVSNIVDADHSEVGEAWHGILDEGGENQCSFFDGKPEFLLLMGGVN